METLTQEMLDNQRDVVMNERRQSVDDAPYVPSTEKLLGLLFPKSHPYSGLVIGSMEDIKAATLDDVRDFYQEYYAPANATLVIAGDFKNTEAKELVKKYFGNLARRETPVVKKIVTPPITKERRLEVEEPVQLVRIKMGWLSPKIYTARDADADGLAFALGSGKSSRFYKTLVYEKELAQSVSVGQRSLVLSSIFTITVKGRPGVDAATLEFETQKIIDEMVANGPTETEISRARNRFRTKMLSKLQGLGGLGGRANMLNRYNQYTGDPGFLQKSMERYDKMSVESVHKLAQEMLKSEQRAVVITLPAADPAPVTANVSGEGDKK
ncbi:insulinase family protein, partial [Myxococcota bacterium]|nr:insulinase family protein [Myxococcota bacterium]